MKNELTNIVVPVDFNEPSLNSINYAIDLARVFKSSICLLHVIETKGIISEFFSSGNLLNELTEKAKDRLEKIADKLRKNCSVEIVTNVLRGKPYQKILEIADEFKARFIVLGENHQGDDTTQELGTTVYHVTLKSPVPVITVKGEPSKEVNKIVVPLDLTSQTRRQLFSAISYGMNHGAEIYLVSSLIGGIKMRESRIYRKLKKVQQVVIENGITCHIKLFPRSETPPFKLVNEYAKKIGADLILLMTHKEGYTYDNYIGAFAHHIINGSSVPVLSLTSAASNVTYDNVLKPFIDPLSMFDKSLKLYKRKRK